MTTGAELYGESASRLTGPTSVWEDSMRHPLVRRNFPMHSKTADGRENVCSRHGGRVWAEGREGAENAGAAFYFALPGLQL